MLPVDKIVTNQNVGFSNSPSSSLPREGEKMCCFIFFLQKRHREEKTKRENIPNGC